jgi:signal transduction histidine kinase
MSALPPESGHGSARSRHLIYLNERVARPLFVELNEKLAACKNIHGMLEGPLAHGQRQRSAANNLARRWAEGIGLAAAVGLAYFLAAFLSYGLSLASEGLAVFWPASGVSSGFLIALGSRARWPVVSGVIVAVVADHLIMADPLRVGIAFALSDAAETLIIAGLIERYFGAEFSLDRLRHVLGMLAAAVIGTCVSGIGGVVASVLLQPPTVPILTIWQHWVASNTIGFIAVAPLLIGLAAALRQRPRSNELVEGVVALTMLAGMTGVIISLSQERWETVVPIAWLSPMLFWLAARCRPVFAAAAAFIVSVTVVCTTVFGIGHFGDPSLSIDDRILGAQASILVVALSAYVLAALFAERRESEARLTSSNMMLERERSNKLMNLEAMAGSISHEIKQPLTGITLNGSALLRYLEDTPPKLEKAHSAAEKVIAGGHRISQILDDIRNLFGKSERAPGPVNLNDLALEALHALGGELKAHKIVTRTHLKPELPPLMGHSGQLQQVIINLIQNAIDAMDSVDSDRRVLQVSTEHNGGDAISITIEDTGPGIDPKRSDDLFDAFFTTKPHGMGLGLAICRMIVERHDGKLSVSSADPHGAIFRIKFPQMKQPH